MAISSAVLPNISFKPLFSPSSLLPCKHHNRVGYQSTPAGRMVINCSSSEMGPFLDPTNLRYVVFLIYLQIPSWAKMEIFICLCLSFSFQVEFYEKGSVCNPWNYLLVLEVSKLFIRNGMKLDFWGFFLYVRCVRGLLLVLKANHECVCLASMYAHVILLWQISC